jgi:hypothetical protein
MHYGAPASTKTSWVSEARATVNNIARSVGLLDTSRVKDQMTGHHDDREISHPHRVRSQAGRAISCATLREEPGATNVRQSPRASL